MEEIMSAFDDLLAKLPFNGNKTAIGGVAHVLLPVAVTLVPPLAAAAPILQGASALLVALGLLHKGVKAVAKK